MFGAYLFNQLYLIYCFSSAVVVRAESIFPFTKDNRKVSHVVLADGWMFPLGKNYNFTVESRQEKKLDN